MNDSVADALSKAAGERMDGWMDGHAKQRATAQPSASQALIPESYGPFGGKNRTRICKQRSILDLVR
jgi:hypothetical protein